MDTTFLLILVGILGLGIGFALGLVVASTRPNREPAAPTFPEAPPPVERPPLPPSPAPVAPPPPQPMVLPDAPPTTLPVTPPFVVQEPPVTKPSMNPINVFARAIQADARAPVPPPKSIAAQVDEILQEMLKGSDLESRAIRLLELPGKGMVVMIGLDQYDGVGSVPDEAIRTMIRAAVAEWEKRTADQMK